MKSTTKFLTEKFIWVIVFCLGFSNLGLSQNLSHCKAWLHNDTLSIENGLVFQHFRWNNGNLIRLAFGFQSSKQSVIPADDKPVLLSNLRNNVTTGIGKLIVSEQQTNQITQAYLRVEVTCLVGKIELKRVLRIVPLCPAFACELYVKGKAYQDTIPQNGLASGVTERVKLPGYHWKAKSVEFFDVTDRINTLVETTQRLAYKQELQLRGNLLLLENGITGQGIFILKEAPCSSVQLYYPGYDFTFRLGEAKVVGLGVAATDIKESIWTKAYSSVIGLSLENSELGILSSLRQYQATIRRHEPGRDEMIMMNTWGDLSKDARVNEAFAMKELEAGAKIGITHFQLDDGWQTGRSGNSAFQGGSVNNIWKDNNYWQPHPGRFPNGLDPVVKRGKELGIEISLWFHSSRDGSFANWEKDADVLIGLYKKYGIRIFKNDGVNLPDKQSDINFRKFLDKVLRETNYNVVFNEDATFGMHGGYHYFNEYGNLFLENRFTDWHDYFPFSTLRNLWMLSKYVPPQFLQVEFLNNERNQEKYAGDPFGPANYAFDYGFAITMPAQPLAWFEASGLSEQQIKIGGEVIKKYREIQYDFHSGIILPVGDEPSGRSWTGFQSLQEGKGYFLVFREANNFQDAGVKTWLTEGTLVNCTPLIGMGKAFSATVGRNGNLSFRLPEKNSYVLYSYSIKE